jgi:U4/U6 small nuclear ribonucleoprotein PRP31
VAPSREQEYPLIVASNELVVQIDADIARLHRYIRDLYAPKFPELESLVAAPVDYVRVVQRVGNAMDLSQVPLEGLLPAHTVMVVKIAATTTTGRPLPDQQLQQLMRACDDVLQLEEYKRKVA